MYLCLDCGYMFEDPKTYKESHGLEPPCDKREGCPYCSGAFVKTFKCSECDEWITGSYVKLKGGEKICDGCYVELEIGG